jgi:hypothetical protein
MNKAILIIPIIVMLLVCVISARNVDASKRMLKGRMTDIQTDQMQQQEILLITQLVIPLV